MILAVALFFQVLHAPGLALAEGPATGGDRKGSEATLLAAISSGKSAAAAVGEIIKVDSSKPAALVLMAVRLAPGQAAEITLAALGAGANVYDVVKAAVSGAKGKTAEIVSAAINLMPKMADIIIKAALDAGGEQDDISKAQISATMNSLNSFNGYNPVFNPANYFNLLNGQNRGGGGFQFPISRPSNPASAS